MEHNKVDSWSTPQAKRLAEVLLQIDDITTLQNFLSDVLTKTEIAETSARLEAARLLKAGKKYSEVVAATGLSSRTIARISEWLKQGTGGYNAALDIIENTTKKD